MGDCYYHGGFGGHSCPECVEERSKGLEQGTIAADAEELKIKREFANSERGFKPDGSLKDK